MAVREISPADGRTLKAFVGLERSLVGGDPNHWSVPDVDTIKRFRGRSAFSEGTEVALLAAELPEAGGRMVARCAAYVNHRYREAKGEDVGFVGSLVCAPDEMDAAAEMLGEAETWLASRGVTRVVAPFDGAALVSMGALTDAFDESPAFPLPWTPDWLPRLLVDAGYEATYPLWTYTIDFADERYRLARKRALAEPRCEVRAIDKGRWKDEFELFTRLFNEGFADEWEMHPYTPAEVMEVFGPLKPILDARTFLFAEVDGDPAGFCVGMPDLVPLFRSFRGRLGPAQIVRLLRKGRRPQRVGLIGIGLSPAYRGRGLGRTLAATLYSRYEELGYSSALYYPVNDANRASRALAEGLGGQGRILHHCFDKRLRPV